MPAANSRSGKKQGTDEEKHFDGKASEGRSRRVFGEERPSAEETGGSEEAGQRFGKRIWSKGKRKKMELFSTEKVETVILSWGA